MRDRVLSFGLICLFAALLLDLSGCHSGRSSPLERAVDGAWSGAEIGSDAEYQKLINGTEVQAIAPLDMRRVICECPEPRTLREWPQHLHVGFENERLTCLWTAEIASREEAKSARQRFTDELAKRGYRAVDQQERTGLGPAFQRDGIDVQMRKSGETELFVAFDASSYTGGGGNNRAGVRCTWLVRHPYRSAPPKLAEALAALPAWMKVKYLDDTFFSTLGEVPIVRLATDPNLKYGQGFSIDFAEPVTDKVIGALEKTGFEYQSEASPLSEGRTQKTWYRFSDITYAHVVTSADGKDLRFSCQRPQHKGEPILKKPPPLHPSLRLPREKRPVLTFDQLRFANPRLERHARLFHELADRLAQKGWNIEGYKDLRYSAEPAYTASWQTSVVTRSDFLRKERPYQGVTISLQGKVVEGADRMNTLHVQGTIVPRQGWAARVNYSASLPPQGEFTPYLSATAGQLNDGPGPFGFDHSLQLTSQSVSVSLRQGQSTYYSLATHLPSPNLEHSLRVLYSTPEALRDEVLADIAALRQHTLQELETGKGVKVGQTHNGEAPRPTLQSGKPPPAEMKQKLAKALEQDFVQRETTIRKYFREIHAAVQQALPLGAFVQELSAVPKT